MTINFSKCTTFIFDLDGTIYSGNQIYPGAKDLLNFLQINQKQIFFLSNNSTDTAETIRKKLRNMDLPIKDSSILVATELVGEFLLERYGPVRVKIFGSPALESSIKTAGHIVIPLGGEIPCDVVVVGRDVSFTYDKLHECVKTLKEGVKLVAANPDLYHPGEDGSKVPETGALISAIQAVSGVAEIEAVGKPFHYSFMKIMNQTDVKPESCIMIGDNPFTDIQGGYLTGMHTVWISHGKPYPIGLKFKPDVTVPAIDNLVEHIFKGKHLSMINKRFT